MARKYTKVKPLVEIVKERRAQGETYREIAASYGLEREQVKKLMERQHRKERMQAAGTLAQHQGQSSKKTVSEEAKLKNEVARLQMEVELLRNFLSEAGRR